MMPVAIGHGFVRERLWHPHGHNGTTPVNEVCAAARRGLPAKELSSCHGGRLDDLRRLVRSTTQRSGEAPCCHQGEKDNRRQRPPRHDFPHRSGHPPHCGGPPDTALNHNRSEATPLLLVRPRGRQNNGVHPSFHGGVLVVGSSTCLRRGRDDIRAS